MEFFEPFRIRSYLQIIGERRKSEEETVRAAAAEADMEQDRERGYARVRRSTCPAGQILFSI